MSRKPALSLKRGEIGPMLGYYDKLIGIRIRDFDLYQNQ